MSCPAVIHVYANLGLPKAVVVTTPGPVGPIGSRWLGGTAAPAANLGVVGDWYLRSTGAVYGPKTEAGWGSVVFTLQVPLSTASAQPLAAQAAAGSTGLAADAGHQHPFPTASQVGADPQGTASTAVAGHLQAQSHLTVQQAAAAAPVQSVSLTGPAGWSASSTNTGGGVTLTLALPAGTSLVATADRTNWNAAYDQRQNWDGGSTNLNPATGRASLQLGTAAQASTGDFATAAQGALAASAVQSSDSRLSDSREWSAATVDQVEAEAGTATTRRAWTAQRVRQAAAAWWLATGSVFGRNWAALANAAAGRTALELGTLAQGNAVSPPALGGTTPAAGAFTNLSASAELTLPSGAPATPTARDLYTVAETIRYRDTSNIERMLLNSADNLANLGNTTTARANIGAAPLYPTRQTITAAAGVYTIDVTSGQEFITAAAINGATTFNLSNLANLPANGVWRAVLRFAFTSGAISWFTGNTGYSVKWDGGAAISPTAGEQELIIIEVVGGQTVIEVAAGRGRT